MAVDSVKVVGKLIKMLERPLAWTVQRLPGLFPVLALVIILLDITMRLPSSVGHRKSAWDILHFDKQATINVFHMKSSLGTLPGVAARPDPVDASGDISEGVQLPEPNYRTAKIFVAQLDANRFVNSLLFLTEQPEERGLDHGETADGRLTVDVGCVIEGSGDKESFVKDTLYFAAPNLGYKAEVSPEEGPQLAFNQASRVYKIGLSQGKTTQLIQSDVPNLRCELLYAASEVPVGAVRLIGERRITWYVMLILGAIALWVAGAWVLTVWRRGVAILD